MIHGNRIVIHGRRVKLVKSHNKKFRGYLTFKLKNWTYYIKKIGRRMKLIAFFKGKKHVGRTIRIVSSK